MTLHVSIQRADFARGLKLASSVARKSTMPILESVLLRANGAPTLTIAATDLSVALTAELPCEVRGSGSIALNSADLSRFVSGAAGDEVTIVEADGKRADVKCGKAKYRIAGLADRDFPKMPSAPDGAVEVDAVALRDALIRASYAVSPDESRQAFCGVLFESDGVERCSFASARTEGMVHVVRKFALPRPRRGSASICVGGVAAIVRLLDGATTCRVALEDRIFHCIAGDATINAALLDFECPDVTRYIPRAHVATATVNREILIESIKRTTPTSGEFNRVSVRSTPAGLSLASTDADGETISDEVECDVKGDISFSTSIKYALDALTHIQSDAVTMRTLDDVQPIVFLDHDDPGHTAVVMPMRMN